MIWLLRVDLGAAVWYASTEDATPVDADGTALVHEPTLSDPEIEVGGVPGTGSLLGDFKAEVTLLAPVSVATFEARGWAVCRGRAELSRWTPGTPYQARWVVAVGDVVLDGLPLEGEALSLSLEAPEAGGLADFPPSDATVTSETMTDVTVLPSTTATFDLPDDADEAIYPWVFGRPGLRIDSTATIVSSPATPALLIDLTPLAQRVLLAGHRATPGSIEVYNKTADDSRSVSYSLVRDGLDRIITTADVSGFVGWTYDSTLSAWGSGWTSGITYDDGEEIRGLGDVVLYLLRWGDGGAVHDLGAWQQAAVLLNRVEVGGYIDDVCDPWDVVGGDLMALWPRCVVVWGPGGYAPVVFDDTDPELGPELIEGIDFELEDGARPEEVSDGGTTGVRIQYSYNPAADTYLDSHTTGPGVAGDTSELASEVSRAAFGQAGARSTYPMSTGWLWWRDSAELVAREWQDLLGEPLVRVGGRLVEPDRLRGLPLGAGVRVTSETLGWSARPCWISGQGFSGPLASVRFLGRPR